MKRRRIYGGEGGEDSSFHPSIYTAPPLESTMLIETGNQATGSDCIGKIDTIPVNASMSSGTRLFQYNRFFWNKDLFTFNYDNCCCFVALAYYTNGGAFNLFYPIFLPRTALTVLQSIGSGGDVTSDPAKRKYLIDDLLYYLNGAFTSYNYDTLPAGIRWVGLPPTTQYQGGPSLYGASFKGFLAKPTANNPNFPFFQDSYPPPVKFIYASSNNQIALVRNPAFWNSPPPGFPSDSDIAFQIVSPDSVFFHGTNNPTNIVVSSRAPFAIPNTFSTFGAPSVANGSGGGGSSASGIAEKGWCGQGCYATGFGQTQQDPSSSYFPNQFSDVYGDRPSMRYDLFSQTYFPGQQAPFSCPHGVTDFIAFAQTNRLARNVVLAKKICSLIPSRFFTIESEILTRDQKMQPCSNNPLLSNASILGLEYIDLNTPRTRVDATLSGRNAKLNNGDTCVNHMNPFYSVQSIDLYLRDEFGNFIQNFRTPNGYTLQFSGSTYNLSANMLQFSGDFSFLTIEAEASFGNGVFTIPAWLAAQNPNTAGGNTQPLIGPFSSYMSQPMYGLFETNGGGSLIQPGGFGVHLPGDFSPNMPISGNLIHFGRVLGQ